MDIILEESSTEEEIINAFESCGLEDAVCCKHESMFKKAKALLIKTKLKDITIQLLDSDGYAIRQVSNKEADQIANKDQLNSRQVTVIKALEKVLTYCKKERIQLVGYSDELVALPAHIPIDEVSNASALDINCHGVYKGADAILPKSTDSLWKNL